VVEVVGGRKDLEKRGRGIKKDTKGKGRKRRDRKGESQ
jgi:hypothetical protein